MPRINVKFFASLRHFMPENATNGEAAIDCADGATILSTLSDFNLPIEQCHLVILNGVFIPPDQRDSTSLVDGDTLAVWPPVAGG